MRGGEVIRRARVRSGLSVQDLADRLDMAESEIRAWEATDPAFSVVERAVGASGADLATTMEIPDADPADLPLIDEALLLTPEQRLERMLAYVRFIEAGRAAVREAM